MPEETVRVEVTLDPEQRVQVRRLLDLAFEGEFSEHDWQHALGGVHALVVLQGEIVAHAALVPRRLWVGEHELDAGYVEAVAVLPRLQGRGLGAAVMGALEPHLHAFELCALSTSSHAFYEKQGWQRWRGPTWVRSGAGMERTEDEDEGIMVWPTGRAVDVTASLTCEDRPGDAW